MSNENMFAVRVAKKTTEAEDICSFELVAPDERALLPFSAGSHIDVHIGDGLVRQYSLCNHPDEQHRYQIAVLRDPNTRGGSAAMHDVIQEGQVIHISAPKNHFPLVHGAARSVLLAGGIGITPILCMAERLANIGADFDMHYCTRSIERTAFHQRIATSLFQDKVQFHYDTGAAEQKLDLPAVIARPDAETHLYVCGPGGFIDYVTQTAKANGWDTSNIHFEHFGAQPIDGSANHAFEVKIASTGKCYQVPSDKSVAAVLAENGVEIPVSCEQGVCGTCITRLLEGVADHKDLYFTDDERAKNDQFTPCCSRSKSPLLVLDL